MSTPKSAALEDINIDIADILDHILGCGRDVFLKLTVFYNLFLIELSDFNVFLSSQS